VALVATACAEEPSTAVARVALEEPVDLELALPALTPQLLVQPAAVESGAFEALAPLSEDEMSNGDVPDYSTATGIWDANTAVYFWPGSLEAVGEHRYIGNKSTVDVTGEVLHEGLVLVSRRGSREASHFFFNPTPHYIYASVTINLDRDCGLAGDGHSQHAVWWEFAPGTGAAAFDRNSTPSFATRESQPLCPPVVDPPTDGGQGGGGGGTNGIPEELSLDYTCWMWFTYDQQTLEVLDIQATWCTGGG